MYIFTLKIWIDAWELFSKKKMVKLYSIFSIIDLYVWLKTFTWPVYALKVNWKNTRRPLSTFQQTDNHHPCTLWLKPWFYCPFRKSSKSSIIQLVRKKQHEPYLIFHNKIEEQKPQIYTSNRKKRDLLKYLVIWVNHLYGRCWFLVEGTATSSREVQVSGTRKAISRDGMKMERMTVAVSNWWRIRKANKCKLHALVFDAAVQ